MKTALKFKYGRRLGSVAPLQLKAANGSGDAGGREAEYGGSWWRASSRSVLAFVGGNKCQRTADAVGTAEIYHRSLKPCSPCHVVETCPRSESSKSCPTVCGTTRQHLMFKGSFKVTFTAVVWLIWSSTLLNCCHKMPRDQNGSYVGRKSKWNSPTLPGSQR